MAGTSPSRTWSASRFSWRWSDGTPPINGAARPRRSIGSSLGETLALAAAVFAATDVDDLALLVAFFANPAIRARDIVIGQFAGIAALYGASVALALAALALPAGYLPYLGILPLALGVRELVEQTDEAPPARPTRATLAAVAGTTLANGGDNV